MGKEDGMDLRGVEKSSKIKYIVQNPQRNIYFFQKIKNGVDWKSAYTYKAQVNLEVNESLKEEPSLSESSEM